MLISLAIVRWSTNSCLIYMRTRWIRSLSHRSNIFCNLRLHFSVVRWSVLKFDRLILFKHNLMWRLLNCLSLVILNLSKLLHTNWISWKLNRRWLAGLGNLRNCERIWIGWRWWTHYRVNIILLLLLWRVFSLEWFDSFDNFHSMKSKYDSKILFKICVCDVLDYLAINANFFELFTVLRQFEFVYKPVWHVKGIPLFVLFKLGCMVG